MLKEEKISGNEIKKRGFHLNENCLFKREHSNRNAVIYLENTPTKN